MKIFNVIAPSLLLLLVTGCASAPTYHTEADPGADATLVLREAQVLRLSTGGSGEGTLTLRGWQYRFEVTNMTLAGVGPGAIQLEGDVYNVEDVKDFEGTYQLLAAEVAAGEGAEGFWFENEKGVRVHIRAEGQDVTIRLHTDGSTVTLKK